jgi:hypothetical protein
VKKKYPYDPTESVVASITATTFFSHEPSAAPPPPPAKGGKAPAKPAGAK